MIVHVGFSCLWHLVFSGYPIMFVVLYKICSRLFESKRNMASYAIFANLYHPIKIAGTGIVSRFSTNNHMLYPIPQPRFQINNFQYRLTNNTFVSCREFAE